MDPLNEAPVYSFLGPQLLSVKILEICAGILLILALLTLLVGCVRAGQRRRWCGPEPAGFIRQKGSVSSTTCHQLLRGHMMKHCGKYRWCLTWSHDIPRIVWQAPGECACMMNEE
jgi:hypothetical protein